MLLPALIAIVVASPERITVTARIVKAQRVDTIGWLRSSRKREIVVRDGERTFTLRLIEFE